MKTAAEKLLGYDAEPLEGQEELFDTDWIRAGGQGRTWNDTAKAGTGDESR